MLTISEVRQKDAERAYQEFFREEFRSQRLGSTGHWFGAAHFTLGLEEPDSQTTLSNLVNGKTPNGDRQILEGAKNPDRVALLQLEFTAPQSLSVLWSMAPATYQEYLESIPLMAAVDVIGPVHKQLMTMQMPPSPKDYAATLGVTFCHGVSQDQSPDIKVTSFVLTHGFPLKGPARELTTDHLHRDKEVLSAIYDLGLRQHFREMIGPAKLIGGIRDFRLAGVPQELTRKFFFDPKFNDEWRSLQNDKPLSRADFFDKWRAQGERLGWGANEAKELLRATTRQKLWADLKGNIQSKVHQSVQAVEGWRSAWQPKVTAKGQGQEARAQANEVEKQKHRH